MESLLQTIVDALSQEYGRRGTPGWVFLFVAIVSVAGAISAKELAKKRKALRVAKSENLETHELRARLFSEEEEGEVEYTGLLKKETHGYRLIIESIKKGKPNVALNVTMDSLDEVAEYLRGHTKFTLADFRR